MENIFLSLMIAWSSQKFGLNLFSTMYVYFGMFFLMKMILKADFLNNFNNNTHVWILKQKEIVIILYALYNLKPFFFM